MKLLKGKDKKGEPEVVKEGSKKPAEPRWRVVFWRQGRKFDMMCEVLELSGRIRHLHNRGDIGYIKLVNILEAPLDDVDYDVDITIDNIISIDRIGDAEVE